MNVLCTGALGHIGSALIREAISWGWRITILDDLSTLRYCSLFDLPGPVRFLEGDVRTAELAPLLKDCDLVVHLAALTDAASSMGRDLEYWSVNAAATARLATACARAAVPLIFPSTTSVYGPQTETVDETLAPDRYAPASPYAGSKFVAENALRTTPGLRFAILRFGTIYGISPGWRNHTAANRFCWQAAHGQPLTIYSGAREQQRPYLDLTDALRAIHWLVDGQHWGGETYNVLTGNHTVAEVVREIVKWVPDVEEEMVDAPILNQLSFAVSAAKIERAGFTFQGDLALGIEETLRTLLPRLALAPPRDRTRGGTTKGAKIQARRAA
jgi:UDP-glucose 4-epimerase